MRKLKVTTDKSTPYRTFSLTKITAPTKTVNPSGKKTVSAYDLRVKRGNNT